MPLSESIKVMNSSIGDPDRLETNSSNYGSGSSISDLHDVRRSRTDWEGSWDQTIVLGRAAAAIRLLDTQSPHLSERAGLSKETRGIRLTFPVNQTSYAILRAMA